jgi:glycosyltransferase involved in cell wall biosynthesis
MPSRLMRRSCYLRRTPEDRKGGGHGHTAGLSCALLGGTTKCRAIANFTEEAQKTMAKLKIIQTPARFYPFYGGVEKYVLELSKKLVMLGNEVTVACADEPHSESEDVQGIKVIRLPYIVKVANTNITPHLFRTLIRENFDVVHTHIPTPWSADVSALVSMLKRKPLCVTYHNDLTGKGINSVVARLYNSTLLHLVLWRAKTIVVTQPKYTEYSSHLKLHRRKIAIVPPGVTEPINFAEPERKVDCVFFMSVLDKHHDYKGLDVLLQAMVKVRIVRSSAKLLIGGGGESIYKYRLLAERLGIIDFVEFLGVLSDQELADIYRTSSIFVLPSLNKLEGFGIVALEALSFGTPVITTHVAGSSDFIARNRAGLIVPPADIDALSDAILTLLEDRSEARLMGERGAAAVSQEFSWDSIARRIVEAY